MPLILTKTQRRKDMLMYDGYTFIREKNGVNDKIIWRCSEWSETKCKGLGIIHLFGLL